MGSIEKAVIDGEGLGEMCKVSIRGLKGRGGWNVEPPHILAGSFIAYKNGCRVSRGKDESVVGMRMQEPEV